MRLAHAQDCDVHESTLKYYGQLIGAVITNVVLVGDEYGDPIPVFIVRTFDGKQKQVEVWADPEGNGAGHADISNLMPPTPLTDQPTN